MRLRRPEIFISATTRDLRTARQEIRDAVLTLGCFPVVEEHFGNNAGVIREILRRKLEPCDAVIHMAGFSYGSGPQEREPGELRRSYTQLEFDLARELGKRMYLIVCAEDFPFDLHDPEHLDLAADQLAHRAAILGGDHLYTIVHRREELAGAVAQVAEVANAVKVEIQRTRWVAGAALALLVAVLILVPWQSVRSDR